MEEIKKRSTWIDYSYTLENKVLTKDSIETILNNFSSKIMDKLEESYRVLSDIFI